MTRDRALVVSTPAALAAGPVARPPLAGDTSRAQTSGSGPTIWCVFLPYQVDALQRARPSEASRRCIDPDYTATPEAWQKREKECATFRMKSSTQALCSRQVMLLDVMYNAKTAHMALRARGPPRTVSQPAPYGLRAPPLPDPKKCPVGVCGGLE